MNTYPVVFAPRDPKGLPWIIPVQAASSASAIASAPRELAYWFAQDAANFQPPKIQGAP